MQLLIYAWFVWLQVNEKDFYINVKRTAIVGITDTSCLMERHYDTTESLMYACIFACLRMWVYLCTYGHNNSVYMYVCMYVCMYVLFVCMYVCMYVCYVCMLCMYVCMYVLFVFMVSMYIWYVCMYVGVCLYVCVYACMCTCTYVCMHVIIACIVILCCWYAYRIPSQRRSFHC